MILTITIISGVMFLFYLIFNIIGDEDFHSSNVLVYGSINVLSSWYLNTTIGIVFLCIEIFLAFLMCTVIWKRI